VVKDILKERSKAGMTVLVSTHQLSVAEEIDDRIGIIQGGRFAAVGTRDELRQLTGDSGRLEDIFLALTAGEADQKRFLKEICLRLNRSVACVVVFPNDRFPTRCRRAYCVQRAHAGLAAALWAGLVPCLERFEVYPSLLITG